MENCNEELPVNCQERVGMFMAMIRVGCNPPGFSIVSTKAMNNKCLMLEFNRHIRVHQRSLFNKVDNVLMEFMCHQHLSFVENWVKLVDASPTIFSVESSEPVVKKLKVENVNEYTLLSSLLFDVFDRDDGMSGQMAQMNLDNLLQEIILLKERNNEPLMF